MGYGVASLGYYRELVKNHTVSYFPVAGINHIDVGGNDVQIVQDGINNAKMFNNNAPCLRIWHQFDMSFRVGKGRFLGMPIFELDTFTDIEKHHLSRLDYLLVNSQWAADIAEDQIKNSSLHCPKIHVVPLGVDSEVFNIRNSIIFDSNKTVFFNAGKWEVRKGHDILCTAFNKAFEVDDKVELWMLCDNPFYTDEENKEWEKYYKTSKLGDKIKIIPRRDTQLDVSRLMQQTSCGVFPSRGEGWNLELLEMMACGKHVIATDYSAHTEFCNNENCKLIDVDDVEPAYDGKWFLKQGNWAKLGVSQEEQLVEHMRQVHIDSVAGDRLNREGLETAAKYSWANVTERLFQCL